MRPLYLPKSMTLSLAGGGVEELQLGRPWARRVVWGRRGSGGGRHWRGIGGGEWAVEGERLSLSPVVWMDDKLHTSEDLVSIVLNYFKIYLLLN